MSMKKTVKNVLVMWLVLFVMSAGMVVVTSVTAEAKSSTGTVYVTAEQGYSNSQSVLNEINKRRKKRGLAKLKLDKSLTASAMRRAAELAIYVPTSSPHRRPNGKIGSAINSKSNYEICLEGGNGEPGSVVDSWMNSASHKKGILLSSAKSAGVGCVYVGDVYYACVEFSSSSASSIEKRKSYKNKTYRIEVLNKYLKKNYFNLKYWGNTNESSSISVGEKMQKYVYYRGSGVNAELGYIPLNGKSFTWKSGDTGVATVSKTGVIKGKASGTVTITASLKGMSGVKCTMKIKVHDDSADDE